MAALSPKGRKPRFIAGGPDEDKDDAPQQQERTRFDCCASDCPMPGTMFPGTATRGICAWHYAKNASDWPRITQVLNDWQCVSTEINEARRVLCDPDLCTDVKTQDEMFRNAWKRLEPAMVAGGWRPEDYAPKPGNTYGDWARHLQDFLAARVADAVKDRKGSPAVAAARTLADAIRPAFTLEEQQP